jgi:hypothetical protein
MKKFMLGIAATAGALIAVAGPAHAAPWQSIHQREARLEMQINQGVRSGALTRMEAANLRNRLANLDRLEANLRRGGLTMSERNLLDRRFDALARSIRVQLADHQVRGGRDFHHFGNR